MKKSKFISKHIGKTSLGKEIQLSMESGGVKERVLDFLVNFSDQDVFEVFCALNFLKNEYEEMINLIKEHLYLIEDDKYLIIDQERRKLKIETKEKVIEYG